MARRWTVPLLIVDQAIFVASDWAVGVYADRVARLAGRLGSLLTIGGVLSSVIFVAIPLVSPAGLPPLFIGTTALWALSSAALRAPVFSLLGTIGGVSLRSGIVTGALIGISLAGALAPLLTDWLEDIDPLVPMAVAATALAIASFPAVQVDARATKSYSTDPPSHPGRAIVCAVVVFVAAFGTQVHLLLASGARGASVLGVRANLWQPLFWFGFAVGLGIGRRLARRASSLIAAALALLAGAFLIVLIRTLADTEWLYVVQPGVGVAWGTFLVVLIIEALRRGGDRGLGTAAGLVFSALALAALCRLALGDSSADPATYVTLVPVAAWLGSCGALLAVARRPQGVSA